MASQGYYKDKQITASKNFYRMPAVGRKTQNFVMLDQPTGVSALSKSPNALEETGGL